MTEQPRPALADFWRHLPREGKMLLSVVALEFIGTGLVLPFGVVYLHEVRGFSLTHVGLLLGLNPLVAFALTGPGGLLIDRIGARRVMVVALVLSMVTSLLLMVASSLWVAAVALVIGGLSQAIVWPGVNSLIAAVVPAEIRQRYYGVNFTLLNLGIGLGGLIGGAFVDVDRLITFQVIYLADAVSFLPAVFLLTVPLRHVAPRPVVLTADDQPRVGYRDILRHRGVVPLLVLTFVASFVGYSQLNNGMPAYARVIGEVSTRTLGFAYAANTFVIVVLQLLVLQRIEGRRRTRVIAVMGVVWAISWLALGLSGILAGTVVAAVLVIACASIFAFGETLLQPTIPAITNDLATDELRGRYNALSSGAFQSAAIIAPPIAGLLIGQGLAAVYIAILVLGTLLCGVLAVLRLEPVLSPEVNGVQSS